MKKTVLLIVVLLCLFGGLQYGSYYENEVQTKGLHNQRNILYDNKSNTQRFDIAYPKEKRSNAMPVVIYVHGGSYISGSKETFQDEIEPFFTKNGYICISANYRLSGEKKFPGALDDIKSLVRYLKANAHNYGIDKNRINLLGFSAGANLVSLVGGTQGIEALGDEEINEKNFNSNVNAIIAVSGFYDVEKYLNSNLNNGYKNVRDSIKKYYSDNKGKLIQNIALANNVSYLKNTNNPMLLLHGTKDTVVNVQETIDYCRLLKFNNPKNEDIRCDYTKKISHHLLSYLKKNKGEQLIKWLDEYNKVN